MTRPFNFSAGPAAMPLEVLQQAAAEMTDWHGSGMGVMEMSHRGKEFISIYEQADTEGIGRLPGLGADGAQEGRGMEGAGADFDVVGLQQGTALLVPEILQRQDDLLKSQPLADFR